VILRILHFMCRAEGSTRMTADRKRTGKMPVAPGKIWQSSAPFQGWRNQRGLDTQGVALGFPS